MNKTFAVILPIMVLLMLLVAAYIVVYAAIQRSIWLLGFLVPLLVLGIVVIQSARLG